MSDSREGHADQQEDWQRLDKWLWCARFMKARTDCAALAGSGLVRINRQPTDKPHARLRVGDVVTLPLRHDVLVVRVLALAARRRPAAEARLLYAALPQASGSASVPCTPGQSSAYAARAGR